MRALKIRSIEPPVESKPLGSIWSVNEINDFGNHENINKHFYMNQFFQNGNSISHEILYINLFQIINMVLEIFNFFNRPNWTEWFRLNRWFNRSDFLVPSLILSQILWKFKPKFHSTTHVVRKMTFWFSISKWKMRKTSIWFKQYHKFCTPFKSSLRGK